MVVANTDVCKDDEWSYLCNKDAWSGSADAAAGGQDLQDAAFRRAFAHIKMQTDCSAGDVDCAKAKAVIESNTMNIPEVRNASWIAARTICM